MWHSHNETRANSGKLAERAEEFQAFFRGFVDKDITSAVQAWGGDTSVLSEAQKNELAGLMKKFFDAGGIPMDSKNNYEDMLFQEFGKALG